MNSFGNMIMCFKDDLTTIGYRSLHTLMLATPHSWCGIIIFYSPSSCLDFRTSEDFSKCNWFTFTPIILSFAYSTSKRLLRKSHKVLNCNCRRIAVFKKELNLIFNYTASKDLKHKLKTSIAFTFAQSNSLNPGLLYKEMPCREMCSLKNRKFVYYCLCLWTQIHEIWICIVQGSWQQLQISGPVVWNELFF